jgi:hypothetical protein
VSFERLTIGDAIAWVAALALVLFTAVDWYSTVQGNEFRSLQHEAAPHGAAGGEVSREVEGQAKLAAQAQEHNLWQEHRTIDRVILIVLLAAAALSALAAVLRVADRRFRSGLSPSAFAAAFTGLGALLVLYRIVQQPGDDTVTTLKSGPWLALIALGALGTGAAIARRAEREGRAWKDEPPPAPTEPTPRADPA